MVPLPGEDDLAGHYEQLADRFDANWVYSGAFVSWMTSQICDRLRLRQGDRVLDAGCGTGLYARGLAERAGSVVCADASAAMLRQLPAGGQLVPVCASVEEIASGRAGLPYQSFDVVLAKEVLHHVPRAERAATLQGLVRILAPGGRLLVVMLPPVIEYPLFEAALRRYERRPIDPAEVAAILQAGGGLAEVSYSSFRLALAKERWLRMVADRYMSLLAGFSEEELSAGIREIDERFPAPVLEFEDRFAFILATVARA
jgi:ubiquinone/menaquinone biosynthesis C-methylase UbiE